MAALHVADAVDTDTDTRIVVVDDHQLLAQMLSGALRDQGFDALVAEVDDAHIVDRLRDLEPDVVLLDAVFGDDEDGGMRVLRGLTDDHCDGAVCDVVVLTGVTDELRHAEFLDAGALAVVSKAHPLDLVLERVHDAIRGIDLHGSTRRAELAQRLASHRSDRDAQSDVLDRLTDRERATLQALVDGSTVDEIAAQRTVALSTVRSQVRAILQKLDAHSQIQAVAVAARHGMRPTPAS